MDDNQIIIESLQDKLESLSTESDRLKSELSIVTSKIGSVKKQLKKFKNQKHEEERISPPVGFLEPEPPKDVSEKKERKFKWAAFVRIALNQNGTFSSLDRLEELILSNNAQLLLGEDASFIRKSISSALRSLKRKGEISVFETTSATRVYGYKLWTSFGQIGDEFNAKLIEQGHSIQRRIE